MGDLSPRLSGLEMRLRKSKWKNVRINFDSGLNMKQAIAVATEHRQRLENVGNLHTKHVAEQSHSTT